MELLKNKYEPCTLFESAKDQELSFYYNDSGSLSIHVWDAKREENISVFFRLTKDETANLVAFLHHIEIL